MKLTDIALAVSETAKQKIIGVRPGEKLHEQMIGIEDSPFTYEYESHFKILPQIHEWSKDTKRIKQGQLVTEGFSYSSDNNPAWMSIEELRRWIEENKAKVGNI